MNPALVEMLGRDRSAELRRGAAESGFGGPEKRRHHVIDTARQETGWLLVGMGLRLAGSGSITVARGQR